MSFFKKLFYLFLPIVIGTVIGLSIDSNTYYETLVKPILSPPAILFPIIWSIIYLLLGISFYIYKKRYPNFEKVDILYYVGLIVNALWSIIFFSLKLKLLSVIWIIILLVLLILLEIEFFNKSKASFYLNILYLLWVIFATYLTISIYILN